MQKLESLKNDKFAVTQDELLQIKGGYGSMDASYKYSTTDVGGEKKTDQEVYDVCTDF